MTTAEALIRTLESSGVSNSCGENANLVDVLVSLASSGSRIANAITPTNAAPGHDANGGHVASLTEAVMGLSFGLERIADSISELAQAVRSME